MSGANRQDQADDRPRYENPGDPSQYESMNGCGFSSQCDPDSKFLCPLRNRVRQYSIQADRC